MQGATINAQGAAIGQLVEQQAVQGATINAHGTEIGQLVEQQAVQGATINAQGAAIAALSNQLKALQAKKGRATPTDEQIKTAEVAKAKAKLAKEVATLRLKLAVAEDAMKSEADSA